MTQTTQFALSPDGTRIAYDQKESRGPDRSGAAPPIILLHGGGGRRGDWQEAGYVSRLQQRHEVISMDLRGHGESDRPADPAAYTVEKLQADILAVAEACGVGRFVLCGFSYGGKVGRYLAARSGRVSKFVMMGTPMGPAVEGPMRQMVYDFRDQWAPVVAAQRAGTLDLAALPAEERAQWEQLDVPVVMAWSWASWIGRPSNRPISAAPPSGWSAPRTRTR